MLNNKNKALEATRMKIIEGIRAVVTNRGIDKIKNRSAKFEIQANREKLHSPIEMDSGTKFKQEEPIISESMKFDTKNQNSVERRKSELFIGPFKILTVIDNKTYKDEVCFLYNS